MTTLENTTTKNNKNQLHREGETITHLPFDMRTEDAQGIWSRVHCSPGLGWWSSCSPLQEGGSAEDSRFAPSLLLWPAPESWGLAKGSSFFWPHICWRSILVHMKAQPNPSCGGPELSRLTGDLAQLTSAKGLWEAPREVGGRRGSASALLQAYVPWCTLPLPAGVHSESAPLCSLTSAPLCSLTKGYVAEIGRDLLGVKLKRKARGWSKWRYR